jgi:hypothetical protein
MGYVTRESNAANPAQRAAIDEAILTGYSARGYYVTKQALNLSVEISDPNHRIVRWRLLVPAIGHILHLPGASGAGHWLTLDAWC